MLVGDGLGAGENGPGVGGPGPGGSGPETGPKEASDPGGLGSESFFMNKMMAEMEIISGQVTETNRRVAETNTNINSKFAHLNTDMQALKTELILF